MKEPDSLQARIRKTETLISFLGKEFRLTPETESQEWPRSFVFGFENETYRSVFSIFGSFTLLPLNGKTPAGNSPIYYLSLDFDPSSEELVWTEPDGQCVEPLEQIPEKLERAVSVYEAGIAEIGLGDSGI
ncbi:hypothetical protein CH379_001125 [Leptospira ellisii]|uniref:Uncharacterized protein n=1 Tax=Leptospira ellisii TaxID=2023197 RepID=A0A2N0BDS2_9LEPT|nr:hypothetical protein [Leptospira ellisii]MDV6234232.1 hypothetical protein [Leptospira ellisii]PJZ94719.1 hypothetical protein CH379_01225 [Leptospira ellisii]PKA05033.1 hypothetical protein CH375_07410 [Leptospira ellisii]